jgi:hypothetical protein
LIERKLLVTDLQNRVGAYFIHEIVKTPCEYLPTNSKDQNCL